MIFTEDLCMEYSEADDCWFAWRPEKLQTEGAAKVELTMDQSDNFAYLISFARVRLERAELEASFYHSGRCTNCGGPRDVEGYWVVCAACPLEENGG